MPILLHLLAEPRNDPRATCDRHVSHDVAAGPLDNQPAAANTCMMTQLRKPLSADRPQTPKQAACSTGPLDELLDPAIFKALSDPTRLAMLACIAKCGRGCSVTEIAECCSIDLSVVSRHLSLLAAADILDLNKQGRTVTYTVRYQSLVRTFRAIADALLDCHPDHAGAGCGCGTSPNGCCSPPAVDTAATTRKPRTTTSHKGPRRDAR